MKNNNLDDVSRRNEGESIDQKVNRLFNAARKNDTPIFGETATKLYTISGYVIKTMVELAIAEAIAEEREANVKTPKRTLMQTANMLPHGWTMQIDLQQGSGGISLFGPFDDLYELDTGNGIEADMAQAVQFANFRNDEQEMAVTGAWCRFVTAMGDDMPAPKAEVSQ